MLHCTVYQGNGSNNTHLQQPYIESDISYLIKEDIEENKE